MPTTLYINDMPIVLPAGSDTRKIYEAIQETLKVMGLGTDECKYLRNIKGERLKLSGAKPGETYIAEMPGQRWQSTLHDVKGASVPKKTSLSEQPLPENIDLPRGVITSIKQLNDSELRPSIFGGCSRPALITNNIVEKKLLDELEWVKHLLHEGIEFNKCARKTSKLEARTLSSNETFTVFIIKGGRRIKKIPTADIVSIIKGKSSQELENTSFAIAPQSCLVLQTNGRSLSLVFPQVELRDRLANALESLLGVAMIHQDNVL